jgi:hypothetical protein
MQGSIYFPEPGGTDYRERQPRETRFEWLARSKWSRASETRAFYNAALAALPPPSCEQLLRRIKAAGQEEQATFEMLVGRFLQLRGGLDLTWEPEGEGGRHVDWRATYPEGALHVEATVPVYNAGAGITLRRQVRFLEYLKKVAPAGWRISPHRLPDLIESAPMRPFKDRVNRLLAQLPRAETVAVGTRIELGRRQYEDRLWISAYRTSQPGGLGLHGGAAYFDNSELRIKAVWDKQSKRQQGRSVPAPALLAILGGFGGADLEAFENALFGRDVRSGRPADGCMAIEADPPWAGVLAFPEMSPARARDPVLFVAPAYTGPLPAAVERLEVRRLGPEGYTAQEARDRDVMAGMRWAKP